jgi:hypothetical protein
LLHVRKVNLEEIPEQERKSPKGKEAKIAQFATQYRFRLRFYSKGMCAIFDKLPPLNGQMMDAPVTPKA